MTADQIPSDAEQWDALDRDREKKKARREERMTAEKDAKIQRLQTLGWKQESEILAQRREIEELRKTHYERELKMDAMARELRELQKGVR
jgi:hypothetical protein